MDFNTFLSTYGMEILGTLLTALAGYLAVVIKNLCQKYLNNKTKQDVAKTCVKAVEQIYKDLHGDEKLNKALETTSSILQNQGIQISDAEMRILIESALAEFNEVFSKNTNTTQA